MTFVVAEHSEPGKLAVQGWDRLVLKDGQRETGVFVVHGMCIEGSIGVGTRFNRALSRSGDETVLAWTVVGIVYYGKALLSLEPPYGADVYIRDDAFGVQVLGEPERTWVLPQASAIDTLVSDAVG